MALFEVDLSQFATQAIRDQIAAAHPDILARVVGEDLVIEMQDHFRRLDAERPNMMGGKRTHYYAEAADAVTWRALGGGNLSISISAPVGLRQHYLGGTISPTDKQWLTLPARAETYGHTAREFDDLRFIMFRTGTAALVQDVKREESESVDEAGNVGSTRRRKSKSTRGEGAVMFWLVKSVTQQADPEILPSVERLGEVAMGSIRDYLASLQTVTVKGEGLS